MLALLSRCKVGWRWREQTKGPGDKIRTLRRSNATAQNGVSRSARRTHLWDSPGPQSHLNADARRLGIEERRLLDCMSGGVSVGDESGCDFNRCS